VSSLPRAVNLERLLTERILLPDAAMRTMIQRARLAEEDYRGARFRDWTRELRGNNDLLSLTQARLIRDIHTQYLQAGADIIETNTFNSTAIALADYGMESLARELNRATERIPSASITKEPSAELKPNQKDSDSLPPYGVLDPLIEALVDLSLPPPAAARRAGVAIGLARDTARRIDHNEYKRRQMPPGPKVTARGFGEGRRYPIAQKFST